MSHLAGISIRFVAFLVGITSSLLITSVARVCVCVSTLHGVSSTYVLLFLTFLCAHRCFNRVSSFQKPSPGLPVGAGEPQYQCSLKYLVCSNRIRLLLLSGQRLENRFCRQQFNLILYLSHMCSCFKQEIN